MNKHSLRYPPAQAPRRPITALRLALPLLLMSGLCMQFLMLPRALAHRNIKQQATWLQPSPTASSALQISPTASSALQLYQPLSHGNPRLPEVALTFDDGPQPDVTPQVLVILQRFHSKATFFCVGQQVQEYPNIVSQEQQEGNLVEGHSWSHPDLRLLDGPTIHQQVAQDTQAIQRATGVSPTFFRPPYGERSATVAAQLQQFGLSTILWSVDPQDWARPGTDTIVTRVLQATTNGSIILLHDGGGNRAQTLAALPTIMSALQQRGLRFVTIQQMVNDLASTGS